MAQPIITRQSDGLRFEPTVQPGMVRCEACLMLCEPSAVREHKCVDWWNVDLNDPRLYLELTDVPVLTFEESIRQLWERYRDTQR